MNKNKEIYFLLSRYLKTLSQEDWDNNKVDDLLDAMDALWWSLTKEEQKELDPLGKHE